MFMADLFYIFIHIIKWFLKSPAFFRSHTKYDLFIYSSMHTVEQILQFFFVCVGGGGGG